MAHIAFFHERFLFRFGHDRTMLLHGRELVRRGHRVTFVAFRADRSTIEALGGELVLLPQEAPSYAGLDAFAAAYLREHWADLFPAGAPDVVVNGGWPFYESAKTLTDLGTPAVFYDAGATPYDGLPLEQVQLHRRLRHLRKQYVPLAAETVSVSRFIAETQTLSDALGLRNTVVLNAVDHLEDPLWTAESGGDDGSALEALSKAEASGRQVLLHLGRWEGGYKNKDGALQVLRRLVERGHDACMLVLADGDAEAPDDLRDRLLFVGHPDDAGLARLMKRSAAGLTTSLWEGFNLALAEMHLLGRPAYALDVGAHREAAIDARYVRTSLDDLTDALAAELNGRALAISPEELSAYRDRMRWWRAGAELEAVLLRVLEGLEDAGPPAILIDVTNASRDPANSGVIRVTRQSVRELQDMYRCVPMVWDEALGDYRLPFAHEAAQLGEYNGPAIELRQQSGAEPVRVAEWLERQGVAIARCVAFYPETILHPRSAAISGWLRANGVRYAAVLHDVIPLSHPEFCDPGIVASFPEYVRFLSGAFLLLANSETTAAAWKRHVGASPGDAGGPELAVEPLAADFGPRAGERKGADGVVRILTVSTLEPRKNHATLLDAFETAQRRAPDLRLELHLVGNGYEGENGVLAAVRRRAEANPSIVHHGPVGDDELLRLYEATDFAVYPSVVEGFGLPVMEAVWHRRPIICHEQGSMAELARGGGALTCDVTSVDSLAGAILDLARRPELRRTLALAAGLRRVRTWREYALACLRRMAPKAETLPSGGEPRVEHPAERPSWDSLLYPDKPIHDWQMNESERMAFAGLLARWRPETYLEIGTFHGGSALLASEFAEWVITVDIEPDAAHRFVQPANVSFVAGRSDETVPALLRDLQAQGRYPEFVLIDGDHTAAGVKRDIDLFLRTRPPRPLLIVFHDSFNPECRAGIASAAWSSPWVHRVEIDFVPGRVVPGGDRFGNQMWGGLAVALLLPDARTGPADVRASSQVDFEAARERAVAA